MKITEEIDKLYNKWLTSCDAATSRKSFVTLYSKLKKLTERIIWDFDKDLMEFKADIYHDILEKTISAQKKDMINNTDFFSSWFRVALNNHLKNIVISENRYKRRNIISASKLSFDYESAEDKYSYEIYKREETLFELNDIFEKILFPYKDKELFLAKHIDGFSEKELALLNNTTVYSIKGRLKRTKQQLEKKYLKLKKK